MILKFTYLFVYFFTCFSFSQSLKPSCEDGTQKALLDFKKGNYVLKTLGQEYDKDFHPFLIKVAKEKYNIRLSYSDCVQFPDEKCYHKTMRERVLNKFGKEIEEKIYAEARLDFENSERYKTIIKPKIDSGFTYTNGRTQPLFPGGETAMSAFIKDNIMETKNRSNWHSIVTLKIEKDGSIADISFYKEPETAIKNEILRLIALMPKWYPATDNAKKTSSKTTVIFYSKERIEILEKNNYETKH